MIINKDRKDSRGKTILEETDLLNITDSICLEEDFLDMQMLVYDIQQKINNAELNQERLNCIYTLEQICMNILERINTKIL